MTFILRGFPAMTFGQSIRATSPHRAAATERHLLSMDVGPRVEVKGNGSGQIEIAAEAAPLIRTKQWRRADIWVPDSKLSPQFTWLVATATLIDTAEGSALVGRISPDARTRFLWMVRVGCMFMFSFWGLVGIWGGFHGAPTAVPIVGACLILFVTAPVVMMASHFGRAHHDLCMVLRARYGEQVSFGPGPGPKAPLPSSAELIASQVVLPPPPPVAPAPLPHLPPNVVASAPYAPSNVVGSLPHPTPTTVPMPPRTSRHDQQRSVFMPPAGNRVPTSFVISTVVSVAVLGAAQIAGVPVGGLIGIGAILSLISRAVSRGS